MAQSVEADNIVVDTPAKAESLLSFSGPLGELLKQCKQSFYFVALLTVVVEILSLSPIIYFLSLFDRVATSRSGVTLVSLLLVVAGVYVLWTALDWVRTRMMIRISLRIDWELADRVFDASFRRAVGRRKVNVNEVMTDLLALRQFLTGAPILALMSLPFSIVFGVIAAVFHIYLAIFAVAAMIVMLIAAYVNGTLTMPVLKAANKASTESKRIATNSLRNSEAAFALGMQDNIRRRWHEAHLGFLELQVNASEASGVFGGITGFLAKLIPSLQISLAIWLHVIGAITTGMVIAANLLLSKALGPIRTVLGRWNDIAGARQAYDRLSQLLREDEYRSSRMALPSPTGQLRVEQLSVKPLSAKQAVLHELNFAVDPGQVLAVVGPSAAGKTSLVKALTGVWPASEGSVRLDGADVAEWLRDDLGRYVGYVPQEIDFFEGTVAENIARLGEVDAEKVVAAASRVGLHHMILSFPQGYDTQLGENGYFLTGGQKQRLALARALYGNPRYVVMDEPNASLDDKGQQALIKTVRELKRHGTAVIFTTHRLQLIEAADRVLVLEEGRMNWLGPAREFIDTMTAESAKVGAGGAASPVATLQDRVGAARPINPRPQSPGKNRNESEE